MWCTNSAIERSAEIRKYFKRMAIWSMNANNTSIN